MNVGVRLVVSIALSIFGSVATVGAYLLVLFTTCFTFRFQRPVYSGFKKKLYLANIGVPVIAIIPAAAFVDTVLVAAALVLGASGPSWWAAIIPALVVVNLATSFFNVWSPVESRLIARRLAAQGVPPSGLRSGIYLGISDPARRDWARMVLEDDVGMLWIEPGRLTYRGDTDAFTLSPEDLTGVERIVLGASLASHLGVRHILLDVRGGERRIRLHVEGHLTPFAVRRATDRLADRLLAWKAAAVTPVAVSA